MAADKLLGVDVGTSSVKAAVIAPDGTVLSRFARSYPTLRHNGRVEQDPEDWVRLIEAALQEFAGQVRGRDIAALGLCSQVNHACLCGRGWTRLDARDPMAGRPGRR